MRKKIIPFMEKLARSKPFESDELQALYDKLPPEDQRLLGLYGLSLTVEYVRRIVDVMVVFKNG